MHLEFDNLIWFNVVTSNPSVNPTLNWARQDLQRLMTFWNKNPAMVQWFRANGKVSFNPSPTPNHNFVWLKWTILDYIWTDDTIASGNVQPWWRHSMETISSLLILCERKPPVDSPNRRSAMWSFDVLFVVFLHTCTSYWTNSRLADDFTHQIAHGTLF